MKSNCTLLYVLIASVLPSIGYSQTNEPYATIDLATADGAASVQGQWRYSDVKIVNTPFLEAGPDGQPGSTPNQAYDIEPKAGAFDFDDAAWEKIAADTLSKRRTAGHLSFNWYRIRITVPERIGDFDPTGSKIVFETSLDDYAEIWVDGELPRPTGQRGGSVISGWNSGNELVIGRNVQPGQQIQLAVFGINGPISQSPTNYIYMRDAKLQFYGGSWQAEAVTPQEVNVDVARLDQSADEILPKNAKVFKLAEGFTFTEGPAWWKGDLFFSDPNENRIYRYGGDGRLSILMEHSGYQGPNFSAYKQSGSNGLGFDKLGRLTKCEHGNRRITRIEPDGSTTVLADRYQGKRLNSPNDLVYKSDGAVYFTDPPFGLPKVYDDPTRELSIFGVYRVKDGEVTLLSDKLKGPNGIAFSPDEKLLYVGNWDDQNKAVIQYPVLEDGSVGEGSVLVDLTDEPGEDAIDGLKVDAKGNVYISGPGGLWVVSPAGKQIAQIKTARHAHNMAWGGDGRSLYLMAQSTVYRLPLLVEGSGTELLWSAK